MIFKVAILNYFDGSICIEEIPDGYYNTSEDIENYLDSIGYKLSEISWMTKINGIPVYKGNDNEPFIIL